MCERRHAGRAGDEARPDYTPYQELDPASRALIEQAALEEITHFGATGDPEAIARLAVHGRSGVGDASALPQVWQVSDYMEDLAARLRAERAVLALFGGLALVHRLAVRG